jgi:hypothetical protein
MDSDEVRWTYIRMNTISEAITGRAAALTIPEAQARVVQCYERRGSIRKENRVRLRRRTL